jgi:antitoxin ParD1/3/4
MATMNVSLPDQLKAFAEARAEGGPYSNVSDYVRDLIRRDQMRQRALAEVQGLIDEGLASGPALPFAMDDFLARKKA